MSSANNTASGLIARSEKFSYIEAIRSDAQDASFSSMKLGFSNAVASNGLTTSGEVCILLNCDAVSPGVTLSSSDASVPGRTICIKGIAGTSVTDVLTEGSETIDGNASSSIDGNALQSRTYMSDGSNWWIISEL
jgi:hypothetical protein